MYRRRRKRTWLKEYIVKELESPQAAANVLQRIAGRIRSLENHPQMGASLSAIVNMETAYRYLVCGNYLAFYRYENGAVYIDRVLYGKRDYVKTLFADELDKS